MSDLDLIRLQALTDAGDHGAALALLKEARRRADQALIEWVLAALAANSVGLGDWLEARNIKRLPAGTVRWLLFDALGALAEHHANYQTGFAWNLNALRVTRGDNPALVALESEGGWLEIKPYDLSEICLPHVRPQGFVVLGAHVHYLPAYLERMSPAPSQLFWDNMTYLAPEVVAGRRRTIRTDLYTFAVMGYALWTGELPYLEGPLPSSGIFRRCLRNIPPKHLAGDAPSDPDGERLHRVLQYIFKKNDFPSALDMQRALSLEPLPDPIPRPTAGEIKPGNKPESFWKRLGSLLKRR